MTHLAPRYLPDYGKDDCDFIHLEGEFEFRADLSSFKVYEMLSERAEMIGGMVTMGDEPASTEVHPWNGPGHFVLKAPSSQQPVDRVLVKDRDGEIVDRYPIEEMRERGEKTERMKKALEESMTPATDSDGDDVEEGERYRLNFGDGTLDKVDDDGEGDDE